MARSIALPHICDSVTFEKKSRWRKWFTVS
jgi:hypothetical protein